jgi:alkanesulfonate monooxygenase SsuD/methylene tetrahydromethanopterin reductase-like flavin-dependent oxidoreductase (luciferase family)
MRGYLELMDAPTRPPAPDTSYPRIIAANGPKMLALAGEIADGAMPAMMPTPFTAGARQVLGPDRLLVVGLSTVADPDPERAQASDQTVDTLVAHSDSGAIAAKVREHLVAGADHVTLLPPMGADFATEVHRLEQLAPVLAGLA